MKGNPETTRHMKNCINCIKTPRNLQSLGRFLVTLFFCHLIRLYFAKRATMPPQSLIELICGLTFRQESSGIKTLSRPYCPTALMTLREKNQLQDYQRTGNLAGYRSLTKKFREIHGQKLLRNLVYAMMEHVDPGIGKPKRALKGVFTSKVNVELPAFTDCTQICENSLAQRISF